MTREELIAKAEQDVRLGQGLIFRQQELIFQQASSGTSTRLALDMLKFYQSLQAIRDGQLACLHRRRAVAVRDIQ